MPITKYNTKVLFITGGVISGIGKGISTASIALLLKSAGYKISVLKVDMYLNVDAGTINPVEHGEVFVTDDAIETDQDVGNYERFLSQTFSKQNYLTMGKVYWDVLNRERALGYQGKTVQGHIHIPEEIISKIKALAEKDEAEILLVEVGGTVGEYQNIMFFEAMRRLKQKYPQDVFLAHLVYLITPKFLGEMKSKPAQASIYDLYELGLQPDFVICRSEQPMDNKRKETIAFNTGIPEECIISAPDVDIVYKIPIIYREQELDNKLLSAMQLNRKANNMTVWNEMIEKTNHLDKKVKIAIVGKYFTSGSFSLEDSYLCVIEAIKHASWAQNAKPEIKWFNVEEYESSDGMYKLTADLKEYNGVIVPQGWGSRGVEGKIKTIKFLRENKIPYLGLCFGMQMAVIEYARDILGLSNANSSEVNSETPDPVIYIMPDQKEYLAQNNYGGTIRLGAWDCKLKQGTIIEKAYKEFSPNDIDNQNIVKERHRHRYEVNNAYKNALIEAGLIISGTSPDGKLAEAIELPKDVHPFFVGTQFHPEYKSWPTKPHPLFMAFIRSALNSMHI